MVPALFSHSLGRQRSLAGVQVARARHRTQKDRFLGKPEHTLAEFVAGLRLQSVPAEAERIVRRVVMAVAGTGFAGAAEDGVLALRGLLVEAGGAPQATVLVYGDRLPARAAAQLNGTMCRALDFCDAMAPGPHIGSALFPAALAAAELAGGCSGEEFMTALVAGAELGSRLNLSEVQYDGFDPTGIVVVFSAAAAAARILRLTPEQTLHALALAFNRCGGRVIANEKLNARGHAAVDLTVTTGDGRTHLRQLDIPPGFPGAELDDAQHLARFRDCLAYAPCPPSTTQAEHFLQSLEGIAALPDVRALVSLLVVRQGDRAS